MTLCLFVVETVLKKTRARSRLWMSKNMFKKIFSFILQAGFVSKKREDSGSGYK